jgi:6-phospho-beta-glucosidase
MKIALLGGGGFRTPLAYSALQSLAQRVRVDELVLHDLDQDRLDRVRLVLDGLDDGSNTPRLPVHGTTNLIDALDGADYVWCAIRVGGLEGRLIDERVPVREGVVGQETTGPGGMAFALRSLPALLDIARAVARCAPRAWFINFTNPVGLITEALQQVLGDRVIGVCDTPTGLCNRVAALLQRSPRELWFDYFGLNHLGWLAGVRDANGDLLSGLLTNDAALGALREARLLGIERLRRLGMIPNEYLYYYDHPRSAVEAVRNGNGRADYLVEQQRAFYTTPVASGREAVGKWRGAWQERERTYMADAAPGSEPEHAEPSQGYAEVAAELLGALASNEQRIMILNVANRGSLPFLDERAVVEVPCVVGSFGAVPVAMGDVPHVARELIERIKHIERLIITASAERSAGLALEALALHPLVPTEHVAERIFDGYLAGHASLREYFGNG